MRQLCHYAFVGGIINPIKYRKKIYSVTHNKIVDNFPQNCQHCFITTIHSARWRSPDGSCRPMSTPGHDIRETGPFQRDPRATRHGAQLTSVDQSARSEISFFGLPGGESRWQARVLPRTFPKIYAPVRRPLWWRDGDPAIWLDSPVSFWQLTTMTTNYRIRVREFEFYLGRWDEVGEWITWELLWYNMGRN